MPTLAAAQVVDWINPDGGVWNLAQNWAGGAIPNTTSRHAVLGLDAPYFVTMSNGVSFGGLSIPNPDVVLLVPPGTSFTTNAGTAPESRTLEIQGVVLVNSTGGPSGSSWTFNSALPNTVNLLGNGSIILNANSGNVTTAALSTTNNALLVIGPNLLVGGGGQLTGRFRLEGVLRANDPFGGALRLLNVTITRQGAGAIEADGGVLELWTNNATSQITDVPMTATNGGAFSFSSTGFLTKTLTNVALAGPSTLTDASVLELNNCSFTGDVTMNDRSTLRVVSPSFTLNGSVLVNSSGGPNTTGMEFTQVGSLLGGGLITLNANAANPSTARVLSGTNAIVTLGPTWTVNGGGQMTGRFVLGGVIRADDTLLQRPLRLQNVTITRQGAGAIEADGGVLELWTNNATSQITDVPMTATNGGAFSFSSTGFLTKTLTNVALAGPSTLTDASVLELHNCSFTGDVTMNDRSTLRVVSPSFTLNGSVLVNSSGGPNTTGMEFTQVGSLLGGGLITLNANAANPSTARVLSGTNAIVTLGPTWTVNGGGQMTGRFVLGGVIRADDTLLQRPLRLQNVTITRQGAGAIEADGGVLELRTQGETSQITDVPMTATNGGAFRFSSNGFLTKTLTNVALAGPSTLTDRSVLELNSCSFTGDVTMDDLSTLRVVSPSFTLNGNVLVNSSGGPNTTGIGFTQAGAVTGSGVISLNANGGNLETAILDARPHGGTTTLGPGITLAGRGRIYGQFVTQGLVSPGNAAAPSNIAGLDVRGSLTLASTSTLEMDVASPTSHDTLFGPGTRSLGGARLRVRLVDGFTPTEPIQIPILPSGGPIIGTFGQLEPPPGHRMAVTYGGSSVSITLAGPCPADWNSDLQVNSADISAFLTTWLSSLSAGSLEGDFSGDGQVNSSDISQFLTSWLAAVQGGC